MASRDASASVRFRLASSSPRRPRLQANATRTAPAPRIQKLHSSEVALTSIDASTAPPTIAPIELASNNPAIRPSVSPGVTRASTVSATTSEQTSPAPAAAVTISARMSRSTARIHELAGAREHRRAHDNQRHSPASRQLAVEHRADETAGAGCREQEPVAAGAQVQGPVRVDDQLDGLGSVGELDRCHEGEQRDHERRDARRPQPRDDARRRAVAPGRGNRGLVSAEHREQQRRDGERTAVDDEGSRRRGERKQERADRRADHNREILHGVEQRIGGA